MIIKKEWRILTVGDGDLSFSNALLKYHQPSSLTASVYDSKAVMSDKYGLQFYQALKKQNTPVLFEFDVTDKNSWPDLQKNSFDLVIFQFPLLPAFRSFDEYKDKGENVNINTLNRRLLRTFLINAFESFLDPNGQQLCYITSKDVKPYRQWNLENSLNLQTDIAYLGEIIFDINKFPGYQIRNVDRDKHVKDTQGMTYVWSKQDQHPISDKLKKLQFHTQDHCTACRAGPFTTEIDRYQHEQSKKHQQMMAFEKLWLAELTLNSSNNH